MVDLENITHLKLRLIELAIEIYKCSPSHYISVFEVYDILKGEIVLGHDLSVKLENKKD